MAQLEPGDSLVVSELSRMGRSVGEVITTVDALLKQQVRFLAVKEDIRLAGKQDLHSCRDYRGRSLNALSLHALSPSLAPKPMTPTEPAPLKTPAVNSVGVNTTFCSITARRPFRRLTDPGSEILDSSSRAAERNDGLFIPDLDDDPFCGW